MSGTKEMRSVEMSRDTQEWNVVITLGLKGPSVSWSQASASTEEEGAAGKRPSLHKQGKKCPGLSPSIL